MFYQYNHLGSPDYCKVEKGENFSFPLHLHHCFEIIIVLSGEMVVSVDKHAVPLTAGNALLIFPNQIHELRSNESEHILCIFSPTLVQAYTTKVLGKIPKPCRFTPDRYLIEQLKTMDPSSSTVEKKGLLYSLCAQFDANAVYIDKKSDSEKLLHHIFSFVEQHFDGDCSLSHLSHTLGYDYAYLSRYFKKTIGLSFNAYITHYRISRACYLMENTTLSVSHCAFESGFTSLRSFNRIFKENLHVTPTQYRKQHTL